MQAREDAVPLRERIMKFLKRQDSPELSDILIVRSLADLEPRMLPFVVEFFAREVAGRLEYRPPVRPKLLDSRRFSGLGAYPQRQYCRLPHLVAKVRHFQIQSVV